MSKEEKLCPSCFRKILSAAVICKHCNTDLASENTSRSNVSVSMSRQYQLTIVISEVVSFLGWLIFIGAFFAVLVGVSGEEGRADLLTIVPSIKALIGGLMLVMTGKVTRAVVENTNYNRQMLELMKGSK